MRYIKNGKVVLDGTTRECDLEEKLLRALEIILSIIKLKVEERNNEYWLFIDYENRPKEFGWRITKEVYELLKEVLL